MDLALLAVTALGFIGVFLMLPREKATLSRIGGLIGVMAIGGLFLLLVRQGMGTHEEKRLGQGTALYQLTHGNGVRTAANKKQDFEIRFEGGEFAISLNGARNVGDIIARINGAEGNKGADGQRAVTASIRDDGQGLVLNASTGVISIEPLNDSGAVVDLGLMTRPEAGKLTGSVLEIAGNKSSPTLLFYVFAAVMIMGAAGVVSHPKPVYAALYFVLVTLAGAALFVLLLAEFMAVVLIIVYAGAILVTYVFVLMLASQGSSNGEPAEYDRRASEPFWGVLVSFVLLGTVLQALYPVGGGEDVALAHRPSVMAVSGAIQTSEELGLSQGHADRMMVDSVAGPAAHAGGGQVTVPGNMQVLGVTLYGHYALSLELAGVLLTIALVGAVVIARKDVDYSDKAAGTGALPVE